MAFAVRSSHVLQVRVVEFNTTTSFHEQLQVIAGTGVFISVHTSNLANAQFLPPGAAVFEIIQRNWVWENLDRSFQVRLAVRIVHPHINIYYRMV